MAREKPKTRRTKEVETKEKLLTAQLRVKREEEIGREDAVLVLTERKDQPLLVEVERVLALLRPATDRQRALREVNAAWVKKARAAGRDARKVEEGEALLLPMDLPPAVPKEQQRRTAQKGPIPKPVKPKKVQP
jgi:hypothetical protein